MADEKQRNIVHIHEGDDLVIHWEDGGLVLLSKARFYRGETSTRVAPRVTFEGVSLRTILPPGHTLEVAEVKPENVDVAVDQLKAAEPPVL